MVSDSHICDGTIETCRLKVRSPVCIQTGLGKDYSHCEAKYFDRNKSERSPTEQLDLI
jgi:hypothetical protein